MMALRQPRTPRLASYRPSRPIPKKHRFSVMMLAELPGELDEHFSADQINIQRPEGIVCYKSESGEMICEGYDEGPRFQTTPSIVSASLSRDAEIIDLLQKSCVQLGDASFSLYKFDKEAALLQEDF